MKQNEPHWIAAQAYPGTNYPFYNQKCSECGYVTPMVLREWQGKCPRCGVELESRKD